MSHYQMISEGLNSESNVTYTLTKDGQPLMQGALYVDAYARVLEKARDTDTFSESDNGERWTVAQLRAWKREQDARLQGMK